MKDSKKNNQKAVKNVETKSNNGIIMALKYIVPIIVALLIFLVFKLVTSTYRMTEINLDKYKELVDGTKQSMVFVTSNDCDTCTETKELLKKMLQGSNIKTYEINIDNLNDEEKEKLMNTLAETSDGVTAPALLIVKDSTLVSSFYGPFDEDLIIEYLQNNSLVKRIDSDTNNE